MAMSLDPSVELSLIQQRFPDIAVTESGALVSGDCHMTHLTTLLYSNNNTVTETSTEGNTIMNDRFHYT